MPILGLGLMVSGIAVLGVSWLSWSAGYPVEVALLRGLLAFIAINFVAYLGELVIATAPPAPAAEAADDGEAERRDDTPEARQAHDPEAAVSGLPTNLVPGAGTGREPIPLRPERSDVDERQAA